MWFDVLFWMYSAQIVCYFSASDNHWPNKGWYLTFITWLLKTFGWRLQIKNLYPQSLCYRTNQKMKFFTTRKFCTPGYYTGKMLLAVNNASKVIWNWFLKLKTWNFQYNFQFTNVSKVHRCNMSTGCYIFIYALIYVLIYSCPCLKKKKKLRYISCNNLIFEIVNIDY